MNSYISNSKPLLISYFGVLMVLLTTFGLCSEVLVRNQVLEQDSFQYHVELFNSSNSPNIAMGDSHVARGFLPPEDMINLSYPSEGIEHFNLKIQKYFENKPAGKIILTADPHLFAPYRTARSIENYSDNFKNIDKMDLAIWNDRYRPQLVAYWRSYLLSGGKLQTSVEKTKNGTLLSPGDISLRGARYLNFEARSRIDLHSINGDNSDKLMAKYEEMLAYLTKKNADICMVTFPLSAAYLLAFDEYATPEAIANRKAVLEKFQLLAHRYGARYIDHQRAVTASNLFRDVDHLNRDAAPAYSRKLFSACFDGR